MPGQDLDIYARGAFLDQTINGKKSSIIINRRFCVGVKLPVLKNISVLKDAPDMKMSIFKNACKTVALKWKC